MVFHLHNGYISEGEITHMKILVNALPRHSKDDRISRRLTFTKEPKSLFPTVLLLESHQELGFGFQPSATPTLTRGHAMLRRCLGEPGNFTSNTIFFTPFPICRTISSFWISLQVRSFLPFVGSTPPFSVEATVLVPLALPLPSLPLWRGTIDTTASGVLAGVALRCCCCLCFCCCCCWCWCW